MHPIVFLPGMMCDARLFEHQLEVFSSERAVQVGCLTTADNVEQLARQVLNNAPLEFVLVGLSMGGIVAMEIIRQAPERVTSLALLDTNPLPEPDDVRKARADQVNRVRAGGLENVMRDELKPHYLFNGPRRTDVLDVCLAMALDLGEATFAMQAQAITNRPDQQSTLRHVRVPTLVMSGDNDRLCPMDRHTLMHELIPHSSLVVIPNAGHLPTLEQPALTTRALQRWLQKT
ncbi:MAG: alpha/beta fold hydrolase [Granulosicoccus sp.]